MKKSATLWTVVALAVLAVSMPVAAADITVGTITNETDIVNTGGDLVEALNFGGTGAVTVNGIRHANSAAAWTEINFSGDYGLTQANFNGDTGDLFMLMDGITGANAPTGTITFVGLSIGTRYLFQSYWLDEDNSGTMDVTIEGDSTNGIAVNATDDEAVLISYDWVATDNTLTATYTVSAGNCWSQGFSLQTLSAPLITVGTITNETDIVNTGGDLVEALNFGGTGAVTVNGILHENSNGDFSPANFSGDWGDPDGGTFSGDLFSLLDGIVGADNGGPATFSVTGLTVGQSYLFQTYWLVNGGFTTRRKDVTFGAAGPVAIPANPNTSEAVLMSYAFDATNETLNVTVEDPTFNTWLQGYSLQVAPRKGTVISIQ